MCYKPRSGLYILTFGLYFFYWNYRCWRIIRDHNARERLKKYTPFLRTIGQIIPIYNIYLLYKLFKSINNYADKNNIKADFEAGGLIIEFILLGIFSNVLSRSLNTGLTSLIGLFSYIILVIPFWQAQSLLNETLLKTDRLPIKRTPYPFEYITFIGGTLFILLAIFGALYG